MVGKSVVTLDGLSTNQILDLLHKAEYIDSHRKEIAHTCDGRVLATLFYEPSTRTRLSFETAMLRLGGKVIGFAGAQLASVTKGESIADTLKTVSNYVDVVAIRHPKEGAALVASRAASVPVINAGDGGHMHPTQTLADLATLQSRFGRITDLTVGLCGDLTFGRTVHSLIETLCRFGNVRFVLISPDELKTPQYVIDLGTTTNIEVIDAHGTFVGGVIAPGLALGARSLSAAAARLPQVEPSAPARVIGRNTREAMRSGVVLGEVARIDGMLDMVLAEMRATKAAGEGDVPIVITGDDAEALAALVGHSLTVDDALTLRGLAELYHINQKPRRA